MAAVTVTFLEDDIVALGAPHVPVALLVVPSPAPPLLGHEVDEGVLVLPRDEYMSR